MYKNKLFKNVIYIKFNNYRHFLPDIAVCDNVLKVLKNTYLNKGTKNQLFQFLTRQRSIYL